MYGPESSYDMTGCFRLAILFDIQMTFDNKEVILISVLCNKAWLF